MEAVNFLQSNWWIFGIAAVGSAILAGILQLRIASGMLGSFKKASGGFMRGKTDPFTAVEGAFKSTARKAILPTILFLGGTVGGGICGVIGLIATFVNKG